MKILLCAGTRPNFVKIAPLYHEAKSRNIDIKILHTGQHYDYELNGIFFEQLKIPDPDIHLNIKNGNRLETIQEITEKTTKYLKENPVDFVLTVGDVNSTLACTQGSVNADITVVHIEAGLRSHENSMPEEKNRLETDLISNYLFISEPDGIKNLKIENLYSKDNCFYVGNVMIDSLVNNLENIKYAKLDKKLQLNKKSYALVTLHRPSNVDEKLRLKRILKFLQKLSKKVKVVFPIHPRTMKNIEIFGYQKLLEGITIVPPQGYFQFLNLEMNAKFVITDSGGAQEETSYFGVPCITLRANTERPITLLSGSSVLAGKDIRLVDYFSRLALEDRFRKTTNIDLWDGQTSKRIFDVLEKLV